MMRRNILHVRICVSDRTTATSKWQIFHFTSMAELKRMKYARGRARMAASRCFDATVAAAFALQTHSAMNGSGNKWCKSSKNPNSHWYQYSRNNVCQRSMHMMRYGSVCTTSFTQCLFIVCKIGSHDVVCKRMHSMANSKRTPTGPSARTLAAAMREHLVRRFYVYPLFSANRQSTRRCFVNEHTLEMANERASTVARAIK